MVRPPLSRWTHRATVSPLKALAVDIAQNLERPLTEIAAVAVELGFAPPPITVAVRTGDTSASRRAQMLGRRPSFDYHHSRVALSPAHQYAGPRAAGDRTDGDRRRNPRRGARQAGRPSGPQPRAP